MHVGEDREPEKHLAGCLHGRDIERFERWGRRQRIGERECRSFGLADRGELLGRVGCKEEGGRVGVHPISHPGEEEGAERHLRGSSPISETIHSA